MRRSGAGNTGARSGGGGGGGARPGGGGGVRPGGGGGARPGGGGGVRPGGGVARSGRTGRGGGMYRPGHSGFGIAGTHGFGRHTRRRIPQSYYYPLSYNLNYYYPQVNECSCNEYGQTGAGCPYGGTPCCNQGFGCQCVYLNPGNVRDYMNLCSNF